MSDPNVAFRLCLTLYKSVYDKRRIIVTAFDDLGWDSEGRSRLTCEVRHGGEVIFPRGQLHCALHGTSDGTKARDLVLSLVGMRPGDTDEEYFSDYTDRQREWATEYGEEINLERERRYCDYNGNLKVST